MTSAVPDRRRHDALDGTDAVGSRWWRHRWLEVALLAVLSYVPALTAAPGRMPSDSKLYLYLDPGRLIADGRWSFDARQFAGWVPHQHITFVWPSGPWFWITERAGLADWLAHRLWIGTLLFAAGTGVTWCARTLGLRRSGAVVAGIVYLLSPYLLPYVSRTSVMLLPWAGLGWIVGLTVRATLTGRWRYPAAIALVVATIGSVNVTALVMIVPAPALWLVHAATARMVPWSRVAVTAARTAVACSLVSAWWIVMSVLQRRHGAPVLEFSETLEDVSRTATAPEVARGLGYWLFYVRDPFGATTNAALAHLVSTRTLLAGFGIVAAAVALGVSLHWVHRRFAIWCIAAGLLLGVGVHPIDDPAPAARLLTTDAGAGVALALRSSTRAVPVLLLGIALVLGARLSVPPPVAARPWGRVADRLGIRTGAPRAAAVVAGVTLVAVVNLPAWWSGGFVDPQLERDQDPPAAWVEAASVADSFGAGSDARILQIPGAEFGSFRWGHTVDQPLVALTDRPIVTRDLLPLGSAGAMDLLYALDDRIQTGVLEPAAVAPVARLLGADLVWITNDLAHERYRTARPEPLSDLLAGAPGLGPVRAVGERQANVATPPRLDERSIADRRLGAPIEPVHLVAVDGSPGVVRAARSVLALSGSGDGIVDAAAAGLLTGDEVVLLTADDVDVALGSADRLVVTDSARRRAHHWRGSQDVHGATESRDPALAPLRPLVGDHRLVPGEDAVVAATTTAEQVGPIRATATSYGEAFALLPEHRPVFAVDGDPTTAWLVGARRDPVGERIRIVSDVPLDEVRLRQPDGEPSDRWITGVRLLTDTAPPADVDLDARSRTGAGQVVELGTAASRIDVEITAVHADPTRGPVGRGPVGFVELVDHDRLGVPPTREVVIPPTDALERASATMPLDIVLTRLRTDPTDRWRSDPEPALSRELTLATDRSVVIEVDVRIDARADDDRLASLVGASAIASARLTGVPTARGHAAVDTDPATAWISPVDGALGATLTLDLLEPSGRLRIQQPEGDHSRVTSVRVADTAGSLVVPLSGLDTSVELARSVGPGPVEIVVESIEARTAIDRRFGDPVELPTAIAELDLGVPLRATSRDPGWSECRDDLVAIDGVGVPIRVALGPAALVATDPPRLQAEVCRGPLVLGPGPVRVESTPGSVTGVHVDRVVLRSSGPPPEPADLDGGTAGGPPRPTVTVLDRSRTTRTVQVDGCPDGCWIVLGEGYASPWTARVERVDLGPGRRVDGGFNGWFLGPELMQDGRAVVEFRWTAQRPLDLAWLLSGLAVGCCLGVVLLDRRRRFDIPERWSPSRRSRSTSRGTSMDAPTAGADRRRAWTVVAVWVVGAAAFVGPIWVPLAALGGIAVLARPTRRVAEFVAAAIVASVALGIVVVERVTSPIPDLGWPAAFSGFHGWTMFAIIALAAGTLRAPAESG